MRKYFFVLCLLSSINLYAQTQLKVMTFNLWHGGDGGKQPLSQTIRVIQEAGTDVVGVQEGYGLEKENGTADNNAQKIAQELGWNFFPQNGYGIMSKYPIVAHTPDSSGVKLKINDDQFVWFFNTHLYYIPYQPYQLAQIKYGDYPFISTEAEAVFYANGARQKQVEQVVASIQSVMKENVPIFLTGDFNEPSHLDWTKRAAKAGLCQLKVEWPSTKSFTAIGLKDAYRTIYSNEVKYPGKTWTPVVSTEKEVHDRIDFIFFKGSKVELKKVEIIGENKQHADIVVTPYPSDHRAVVATIIVKK